MGSDLRNLATATERYEVAETGRIDYLGHEWPSLDRFVESLGRYWRMAQEKDRLSPLRSEMKTLWNAVNSLSRAPIHPTHQTIGLSEWLKEEPRIGDSEVAHLREVCTDSVVTLLTEKHPVSNLGTQLKGMRFLRFDLEREIALVTPRHFHRAIRDCIDMDDFSYQLISSADFKRSGVWEAAVYLGPQYASFSGTPLAVRRREVAWMFDAPAARQTIQVMWAGEDFDIADYQLWDDVELKLQTEIGPTRFRTDVSGLVPSLLMPPLPEVSGGVEGVNLDFVEGYRVSYALEFGPKPHVIETDDFDIDIDSEKITKVTNGDVLLMRLDTAAMSFVQTEARNLMGEESYDSAARLRDRFKQSIVDAARQRDAESHLFGAGFDNPQYYLRVCEDPSYIGPNTQDVYVRLCMALRVEPKIAEYQEFVRLRVFHRQAGIKARNMLIEHLKSDRGWEDNVRDEGFCQLAFPGVGKILIAAVLQTSKSKVPLASLGRVTKDGKLVE